MPTKLTMLGVLMALVLGAIGLAGGSASANTPVQSFCTVLDDATPPATPSECPATQVEPNDWFQCYESAASPAPPVLSGSTVVCGANTSATAIPLGAGVPIKIWQIIRTPAGSRLTLPTTYSPPAWTYSSPAAGTTAGDVTALTDLLCTGGAADLLATAAMSPAVWPTGASPYASVRQNLPPVDPDATTLSNNAYINGTRPFPTTFTDFSLDRANLTALYLNGFTYIEIAPKLSEAGANPALIANAGSPLATLVATSPYGTSPKVSVALLGGAASPAQNDFLCLQSPQHSVALTQTVIPPSTDGWYPRWTLMTSDRDFVDAQRTRILDVQCIQVGAPASPDTDGDCLSDADEATNGTNPAVADTDLDMLVDGVEVAAGGNPLAGDADADAEDDYTEMFQYTNPAVADTDGDGSLDKHDDLAGFNCVSVSGVCTVANLGDTTADDNCPAVANASQLNTDSTPDMTNTPNTPPGAIYAGDATNNHQDPQGDACDTDDDNDGLGDILEVTNGFGILNALETNKTWCRAANYVPVAPNTSPITLVTTSSIDSDSDDDGGLDGRECQLGSKPTDATNRFPTAAAWGLGLDGDGDLLYPDAAETFYHTQQIITPVGAGGVMIDDLEQAGSYCSPMPGCVSTGIPDAKIGPADPDSDGDFLNDGVEVKWYATDPANFDTDADGCSDGREAADVNGNHIVNAAADGLGVAQHTSVGSLAPSPAYFNPITGVRRVELATYDVNKDGTINAAVDGLLVAKLTGNCANGTGAQTNTKPIIELSK